MLFNKAAEDLFNTSSGDVNPIKNKALSIILCQYLFVVKYNLSHKQFVSLLRMATFWCTSLWRHKSDSHHSQGYEQMLHLPHPNFGNQPPIHLNSLLQWLHCWDSLVGAKSIQSCFQIFTSTSESWPIKFSAKACSKLSDYCIWTFHQYCHRSVTIHELRDITQLIII